MSQAVTTPYVPLEDYFERETGASTEDDKHEWSDGVVYAMARGTIEHGRITVSVTIALGAALPRDCRGYGSETMLYVAAAKLSTYADLTIVCGPPQTHRVQKNGRSLGEAIVNPAVIVEVLSDSTERYDRDGKFQAYKQSASLEEYILVSQDERIVEIFRRADNWAGEVKRAGEEVTVHGVHVRVDAIYGD